MKNNIFKSIVIVTAGALAFNSSCTRELSKEELKQIALKKFEELKVKVASQADEHLKVYFDAWSNKGEAAILLPEASSDVSDEESIFAVHLSNLVQNIAQEAYKIFNESRQKYRIAK